MASPLKPYVEVVVFTLLAEAAIYIINFIYDVLTLSNKMDGLTTFKRITMPLVRVALVMALVVTGPHTLTTLSLIITTQTVITICGYIRLRWWYDSVYADFTKWYLLWQDHCTYKRNLVTTILTLVEAQPIFAEAWVGPIDIESSIEASPSYNIDHIYSVSPRNTYHIDTVAVDALDQYLETDYGATSSDEANDAHSEDSSLTLVDVQSTKPLFVSQYFDQVPLRQQACRLVDCFCWMLPSRIHCSKELYPLLKRKLSTYSLTQGVGDRKPCCQTSCTQFRYFLHYYYDVTMDDNEQVLLVDPMFLKFGVPSPQFAMPWIILDAWCQIMLSIELVVAAFTVSSIPGAIAIFVSMAIFRLWRQNWVYCQSYSYKRILPIESVIHLLALAPMAFLLH
ncbi:hypothetical protein JNB11_05395 [Kocuria palustris]|nr:hypothetical protein [Kocuria palustris]